MIVSHEDGKPTEGAMNKLCITLLLIFSVWFGWQRYAEHQARVAQEQRERWEGYERCTSGYASCGDVLDQEHDRCVKAQADARKVCADVWFAKH